MDERLTVGGEFLGIEVRLLTFLYVATEQGPVILIEEVAQYNNETVDQSSLLNKTIETYLDRFTRFTYIFVR